MDSDGNHHLIWDGDATEPDDHYGSGDASEHYILDPDEDYGSGDYNEHHNTDSDIEIIEVIPARHPKVVDVKNETVENEVRESDEHKDIGMRTPTKDKDVRRRRSDERLVTPIAAMKRLRLDSPSVCSDHERSTSVSTSDADDAVDAEEVYLQKKRAIHKSIVAKIGKIVVENAVRFTSSDEKTIGNLATRCTEAVLKMKNYKLNRLIELDHMASVRFASTIATLLGKCNKYLASSSSKDIRELLGILEAYTKDPFPSAMDKRIVSGTAQPHQPYSFVKWSDDKGDLHLREIATIDAIVKPLGSAYDAEKGFIFTGNNSVFSCSETGVEKRILVKNLKLPSAIAVIKSGERFALLDRRGILEYNWYERKTEFVVCVSGARGLVYMDGGFLITAVCKYGEVEWRICVYDANVFNKVITYSHYGAGRPSFMAADKNILFVTDLDFSIRSLTMYELDKTFALNPMRRINLSNLPGPRQFNFPSGISVDRRREVILAEANHERGFLLWGTAALDEWREVKILDGGVLPYTASITISPKGYIMAACRHADLMKIYKFVVGEPDATA